jgi:hypothetical protein
MARRVWRAVLVAVLLVVVPSPLALVVEDPGSYPYVMAARREAEMVCRAMRYHGAQAAWTEGLGWFFHNREGRECRLFTDDCVARLRQKRASES